MVTPLKSRIWTVNSFSGHGTWQIWSREPQPRPLRRWTQVGIITGCLGIKILPHLGKRLDYQPKCFFFFVDALAPVFSMQLPVLRRTTTWSAKRRKTFTTTPSSSHWMASPTLSTTSKPDNTWTGDASTIASLFSNPALSEPKVRCYTESAWMIFYSSSNLIPTYL